MPIAAFFVLYAFFTNVENANNIINNSLRFCVNVLIPSIFPTMIFSSIILYTKAFEGFFDITFKKRKTILGICKNTFSLIILSSMSGFLCGPKLLCNNYEKNSINDNDFLNTVILSSNAGIGFLVNFIGIKMWGNVWFGVYLFLVQILSSMILGNLILKRNSATQNTKILSTRLSFSNALSKSINDSSFSMISICGFFVFFSLVCEILSFSFLPNVKIILKIIMEFCSGSVAIFSIENLFFRSFLCGFCFGFGGLCVHFQTFSICEKFPLSKLKFTLFKFIHGSMCGFLSFLFVFIFDIVPSNSAVTNCFNDTYSAGGSLIF